MSLLVSLSASEDGSAYHKQGWDGVNIGISRVDTVVIVQSSTAF